MHLFPGIPQTPRNSLLEPPQTLGLWASGVSHFWGCLRSRAASELGLLISGASYFCFLDLGLLISGTILDLRILFLILGYFRSGAYFLGFHKPRVIRFWNHLRPRDFGYHTSEAALVGLPHFLGSLILGLFIFGAFLDLGLLISGAFWIWGSLPTYHCLGLLWFWGNLGTRALSSFNHIRKYLLRNWFFWDLRFTIQPYDIRHLLQITIPHQLYLKCHFAVQVDYNCKMDMKRVAGAWISHLKDPGDAQHRHRTDSWNLCFSDKLTRLQSYKPRGTGTHCVVYSFGYEDILVID